MQNEAMHVTAKIKFLAKNAKGIPSYNYHSNTDRRMPSLSLQIFASFNSIIESLQAILK